MAETKSSRETEAIDGLSDVLAAIRMDVEQGRLSIYGTAWTGDDSDTAHAPASGTPESQSPTLSPLAASSPECDPPAGTS